MRDKTAELFQDVGDTIGDVADPDTMLSVIVLAAMRVMKARASSLLLRDERSTRLRFHICAGEKSEQVKRFEVEQGEGIAGWVAQTGKARLVPDVRQEPLWSPKVARAVGFETTSLAAAPLLVGDQVIGVLEVIDREDGAPLTEEDLERLEALSDLAASLILQARVNQEVASENRILKRELGGPRAIAGRSPAILKAVEDCRKIAASHATALILGESGVGNELFARLIHEGSPRARRPLVVVNCGALPETLLERELFGHERGAFTGADAKKPGLFEAAHTGSIFLDEIGEMSPAMQVKLLRVLQEGTFTRIGGQAPLTVDVRVIAATNRGLAAMVAEGTFREDLFYRLNVVNVRVPPLRERGGDIQVLAEEFAARFSRELGREPRGFTPEAMAALMAYPWPGNVRQLENAIERAVILGDRPQIGVSDLPPEITQPRRAASPAGTELKAAVDNFKREHVRAALALHGGSRTRAAQALGVQRTYLSRLIKELGVEAADGG
ncbi:MAG: sigma 54-interacting transcriptional regulator [Nitrospinae bacterium]|nr:sigma 54-interacting transcriptional regulator [Nitrospinota bacterium]